MCRTAIFLRCWGVKQPLWTKDWQFLMILNVNLPHNEAILLLGIYSREMKPYVIHRLALIRMIIFGSLFVVAKNWNQPRHPSIGEWIKKCATFKQ